MNKPENPNVFPFQREEWDDVGCKSTVTYEGMSLRDYFAAKAMQGLLSNPEWMDTYKGDKYIMPSEIIAKISYNKADGMLKERTK